MGSTAGGVKESESTYTFSTRINARQYIVADFDGIVLYARFAFREVKYIRLFIIVVREHNDMLYFFRFFGKIRRKYKWSWALFDDNSEPLLSLWDKTITDDRQRIMYR